ncbi:MAG: manganese efflux pump MntP family protein [Alicyclobacillus herbarius]|uniref:manganese efflux pump MntP n=1 Tax=Alicyclobacillus herbarius TaxID=122960 RepID=UPI002356978B|nr:manganese efflux pump [Alicyclobacillus herbarius]MCL6632087.1 manganese efflux pump MntP family protein [Alicyclobacillus herbarius]
MNTVLKMIALILSLGMDTLLMSISLGMVKTKGKLKIALTFACAEALMPLLGLLFGKGAGELIGRWASMMGGIVLLAVAVWFLWFEDEDGEEEKLERNLVERNLVGWSLLVTALSIGLDELAVGFSIGFVGVPTPLTISLIALQAFIFTMVGLFFGSKLKPWLGEWAEKLAGIVLGLLGLWIVVDGLIGALHF